MSEWNGYGSNDSSKYTKIEWVTHTAHIPAAISILKAGEIKQSLVFDESKLNNKRILVSWFSPNKWNTGYRYGTIQFRFNLKKLIENKKLYWVEAGKYKIPAPRILVTDTDNDCGLEKYHFEDELCPLKYDSENDEYSFYNRICLELMIEDSISLKYLEEITTEYHHRKYCSLNRNTPQNCNEIKLNPYQSAARFLATAIVNKVDLKKYWDKIKFARNCFTGMWDYINEETNFLGSTTYNDRLKYTLIRSFLAAVAFDNKEDIEALMSMFASEDDFFNSLCECFVAVTGGSGFDKEIEESLKLSVAK